jgi:hypothetical protein
MPQKSELLDPGTNAEGTTSNSGDKSNILHYLGLETSLTCIKKVVINPSVAVFFVTENARDSVTRYEREL